MSDQKDIRGIADANKPNAGRMYDFFLGGHHNFEVDREAARHVLEISPFMPKILRLVRWYLGAAVRLLIAEGYTNFLDFASGLPTVDHIHQIAPPGTKVIYSDIDPVTVAYAQDIIGDIPDVRYVHCDAAKPEELLNSGIIEEVFDNREKVAIGFNGIAWFLTDEEVDHSLSVLSDWAEEGDRLFLCDNDVKDLTETGKQMTEIYKNVGQPLYLRSLETVQDLISPWTVVEPGFRILEEWVDLDPTVSETLQNSWGAQIYGGILQK